MKTRSLVFWTSLVLLCLSAAPVSAEQYGLFTYKVAGGTVEITDYPTGAVGDVEIPAEIDGMPVTVIGDQAFSACRSLTSVTIPSSVTAPPAAGTFPRSGTARTGQPCSPFRRPRLCACGGTRPAASPRRTWWHRFMPSRTVAQEVLDIIDED